ncbi:dynamin central domain-containing protein [Artemisia annua]|uniref:Dynamin central domain-containing protein n=1 Tax=Artemisia annua TaxID=35608 RepID=A0A2U1NXQ9_ARTAN|nr:dynamin central domain-containing protein [Artemisia annua]
MGTKRQACDQGIIETRTSQPLFSSYNEKIRPILNTVKKLQHLKVIQEGVSVPNIVVIGEQSSGKTSVLESLSGVRLPSGSGYSICTRVPLIIRLKDHQDPVPDEFVLEYGNEKVKIMDESQIANAIDKATVEISGNSKCVSNVPLTLLVKKKGVPDLTLIDLPGITRSPEGDQPENIYEQISDIIMEYIKPEETILLNVFTAADRIHSCESIRESHRVDGTRERTLAVATKCDINPDGQFINQAMENIVNIRGLEYVCVRNRINDETFDEARIREAKLFGSHPLLSKLDKSIVGFPVLANKIVQIQLVIISKCLPNIGNKISEKMSVLNLERNILPETIQVFIIKLLLTQTLLCPLRNALEKILISGEYDEKELDNKQIRCVARLKEMLDNFTKELHTSVSKFSENFLIEEIQFVENTYGLRLPGYLPHFVNEVSAYLESVCAKVLIDICGNSPLLSSIKKLVPNVIARMKKKLMKRVVEWIEVEKLTCFSSNPDFIASWRKIEENNHEQFSKSMSSHCEVINIEGHGMINVKHLFHVKPDIRNQAFELKMLTTAYWEVVLNRMVDFVAFQLRFRMHEMVNKEIVNELMVNGAGIDHILDEPESGSKERERLQRSIDLLQESKIIIEDILNDVRECQSNKQYIK